MKARLTSLLLASVMVFSLTACGKTADTSNSQQPDLPPAISPASDENTPRADFVFTDSCGREVEVPGEVTRIVPSGPLAQIVLYTIAPEMMVGLGAKWYDSAEGIVPEEYLNLPYFGQLYGSADLNVEELAKVDPQLVIDIGDTFDSAVEDMNTLQEQTNIPTVFVAATLETMPDTYRMLGELLNKQEEAEELAQFCEKVYDRTASIMEKVGDGKVNALYILGEEGLNVLAKGSYHSELIDMLTNNLAVVDNPVSKGTGNEVSMEQIALWNPDFIIFAPGSIYSTVTELDTWSEITAVANGDYIEVPEGPHNWMGSPPSVQRCLGLIWLTAELYPQYCDYDVKAEILEFYQLFYHCDLTEEQYEALTANAYLNKD